MLVSLWASEALDRLSAQMQHQDETGKGLLDAVFHNGPVREAQDELLRRASSDMDALFPLSCLVHHYEPHPDVAADAVFRMGFSKCIELAAQLWSRLQIKYAAFPWCLLGVVDDRNTEEYKAPWSSV
jgi:hypothetical protein